MTPEHLPVEIGQRAVNGLMLEVAVAGAADGPLVVLLHGFPDLWQGWHCQLSTLVAAGYRVVMPNQRGYGYSDKPSDISAYDVDVLADDVVALASSEGRETFCLVGHDWGGIVAWRVACRHRQRVERLAILNAPHPGVFKSYLLRSPAQCLRSWYVAFFQLPWLPERLLSANGYALLFRAVKHTSLPGIFDESDRRTFIEGWSRPGALTAMLNYYRAIARRSERSLRDRVQPPALILHGCGDPAEEPGLAIASRAMCDDGHLIEYSQARHWLQRELADEINIQLLSFLRSAKPSNGPGKASTGT